MPERSQEDMTMGMTTGWSIDKRIPVSVVTMLLFQCIAVIVWGVRMDSRVTSTENAIIDLKSNAIKAEAFARLDEKMNGVKDDMSSLKTEMSGFKDEMRRMTIHGK